jgi:prepilin peptidase CpaA
MLLELAPLSTSCWLLTLAAAAAFTDSRTGLIPNWLTLPSLALAPLAQLIAVGPGACGRALLGVLACALVPLLLFGRHALAGTAVGLEIQVLGYALASVWALCRLAYHGALLATLARALRLLLRPLRRTRAAQDAADVTAMHAVRLGLPVFAAAALALAPRIAERWP